MMRRPTHERRSSRTYAQRRISTRALGLAAASAVGFGVAAATAPNAFASGTLYFAGYLYVNSTVSTGSTQLLATSARNEQGGEVTVDAVFYGSYTPPAHGYSGAVARESYTAGYVGRARAWNGGGGRGGGYSLIHARYSDWIIV